MANMENQVKWTAAGLDAIHVAYRNAAIMAGYSNLNAASTPNTGSGMRKLVGAQTAPFGIPDTVDKVILGDDLAIDTFSFAPTDPLKGILELGMDDNTFNKDAEGVNVKAVGIYNFYGRGDSIVNPGNFMFLLTRQAHGDDGTSGWENELVVNTRVKPLHSESRAHQLEGSFRHSVNFNQANKTPWGETMLAAFGTGYRRSITWASLYRSMLHVWIADGAAVVTTALDYTPIDAASTKAFNGATGAALTVSSVNTSTKIVTLSAAPATGVPVVILYQTGSF